MPVQALRGGGTIDQTLAPDGGGVWPFDPLERPRTHCIRGWVIRRAGLKENKESPAAASLLRLWVRIPTWEMVVCLVNFVCCQI